MAITLIDYEIPLPSEGKTLAVRGRPVGKFLAVHRWGPEFDNQTTVFSVDHIKTGFRVSSFRSEDDAMRCAIDVDSEVGDALEFSDPRMTIERIPEPLRLELAFATDDGFWRRDYE